MALIFYSCFNNKQEQDYKLEFGKVPLTAQFIDNDWYIWGGSVVEKDGQYHMFYSRWPKKYHFSAWLTYSEVAHAVADSPFGPFKHKDVALPARGREYWDGYNTHNPTVKEFEGKYYLYYTGTTGDRIVKEKGLNWELSKNPLVSTMKIEWVNRTQKVAHLERPQLFFQNEQPIALMCAADTLDENSVRQSFNVQIPVIAFKK